MNELTNVHQFLAAGLHDDPLLCLAQAVSWLDPFWSDDEPDDFEDDGSFHLALHLCRDFFPDVYAQVVEVLHHGAAYDDLDRLICAEISRRGIPLDSLEGMAYGVPLPAYGAALHDPEFYSHHPDVVLILEMFGVQPGEEDYQVEVPERVYAAGRHLYDSLADHPEEGYRRLGCLIGWLVSNTNNSCIDWDEELMFSVEPLSWEPDDFAFAVEIIREADEIMTSAQVGLELVRSNAFVRQALQDNIDRLYRLFAKATYKEKKKHDRPRLHWPTLDGGSSGATESHP
jgi:hypothetical protein